MLHCIAFDRFIRASNQTVSNWRFGEFQNGVGSDADGSERVLRILIEGKPGYGKTTLALKIASDWAAKMDYMNKYQLVFLIHLRDFQVCHMCDWC